MENGNLVQSFCAIAGKLGLSYLKNNKDKAKEVILKPKAKSFWNFIIVVSCFNLLNGPAAVFTSQGLSLK